MENAYIGKLGYTLSKSELSKENYKKIKKELLVKPFVPKCIQQIPCEPFPIYRESSSKIYLPRFYGINTFGDPKNYKILNNEKISLNFEGELRDYQLNIANKYINHVSDKGGALLEMDTGMGKTVLALYILAQLNVKTIILVHKEFLLNQWVERIQEFLPSARIGRIQGKKVEIDDCQIVMGMIQSISTKDYNNELFKSFGLTIIDEVHHMGAEVFSNALNKIVTQYTLGLSATMKRKDGLSMVFKMFLGEILHSEKRDTKDTNVLVNKMIYKVNDSEFNDLILDYRGNVSYVKMISKICEYNPRNEFILEIIKEIINNRKEAHIILLAHNKSMLKYLYEAINFRKICEVGYYVGGMKEEELKKSESKQLLLATYSMAAEGLDIKTLNTLILATSKTDVVQSVGRILRTKHVQPIIYDIVDSHENFEKQFVQRKRFYIKQKYKINAICNKKFDSREYETIYDPENPQNQKKDDENTEPFVGKCLIKL
tara:strand:- start:6459 stop:7919 length:1461 start_codon:yes stop_codon:yes gene_type:complete